MIKYKFTHTGFLLLFLSLSLCICQAQTNYMQQDFTGGGPYVSSNPNVGQFSDLVSTNMTKSYWKFGPGYMDLVRIIQDSATGGIVRAVRAVPFSPNPETLYIQLTFSVEEIGVAAVNAVFFYTGEKFSASDNKFPPNANLFSRFTLTFSTGTFVIRDIQTNRNSAPLQLHTPVTVTWVLNNSKDGQIYRKPETAANPNYKVMPGKYDLWVDGTLLVDDANANPGSGAFSPTKLSNFEIRFRNGVGRVRFNSLRIRDVTNILLLKD
jgi:hypothetical protein